VWFVCVSTCVWSRNLKIEGRLGQSKALASQKNMCVDRSQYPNVSYGDKSSCHILG